MKNPEKILLSDLLKKEVKSFSSVEFGSGDISWMHLPVHRILGWASKTSDFQQTRNIWRLDQIKTIIEEEVLVKGKPSLANIDLLRSIPSIIDAKVINNAGAKIGIIADCFFDIKTGNIDYYLISRNNPRIPGSSRWKLEIPLISEFQSGIVFTDLNSLEDLLILKSSLREDLFQKSKTFKSKFGKIKDFASNKVEQWLEEDQYSKDSNNFDYEDLYDQSSFSRENVDTENVSFKSKRDEDPWF